MAPPKKPLDAIRTRKVEIRVTYGERAGWRLAADGNGMDLSEWIRWVLNSVAPPVVVQIPENIKASHDVAREMASAARKAARVVEPVLPEEPVDCTDPRLCPRCARLMRVMGRPRVKGCVECKFVVVPVSEVVDGPE